MLRPRPRPPALSLSVSLSRASGILLSKWKAMAFEVAWFNKRGVSAAPPWYIHHSDICTRSGFPAGWVCTRSFYPTTDLCRRTCFRHFGGKADTSSSPQSCIARMKRKIESDFKTTLQKCPLLCFSSISVIFENAGGNRPFVACDSASQRGTKKLSPHPLAVLFRHRILHVFVFHIWGTHFCFVVALFGISKPG